MSCKCELSGIAPQFGNNVSHSQRKTRRRFNPNLRVAHYTSEITGQTYSLKVVAKEMRTIEKLGGLDAYMIKKSADSMSDKAKSIKKLIVKKSKEV